MVVDDSGLYVDGETVVEIISFIVFCGVESVSFVIMVSTKTVAGLAEYGKSVTSFGADVGKTVVTEIIVVPKAGYTPF